MAAIHRLIGPGKVMVASIGNFINTKKLGTIGIEFYYKDLSNLTRYGDSGLIDISRESNWESLIPIGTGNAYGSELSLNKSSGNTSIDLSYTLSWSNRTFEGINNDEQFRYRYDRRHVIHFGINHRLGDHIDLSANWEFGSGVSCNSS